LDAPFLTPAELVRPWRRATFIAGAIAGIELIALLGAGAMLLAKPLSHEINKAAVASIESTPVSKQLQTAIKKMNAPAGKAHPRAHVKIMVLNGNGVNGAAGTAATRLHHLGYRIAGTANAKRQDYATSVVMYKPGFRADGMKLAKAIGVKVVGPIDGIPASSMHGGDIAVIVGA
jgi:LytR cell envelope-related transcriptional attenuator